LSTVDTELVLPPFSGRARQIRVLIVSLCGVMLALLVGGLLVLIAGGDPLLAFSSMFSGSFGSALSVGQLLVQATPLLIIALGLALAFRGRVYNIGAEGQLFMGALAGGALVLTVRADAVLLIPLAMVAGAIGGALWGWLVGFLRARWSINEVISSLLLNYVAIFLFSYAIRGPLADPSAGATGSLASSAIPIATRLPTVPQFFVHLGLFIAIALVPIIGYLGSKTPFGFHVRMMGLNPEAARVAGVETGRLIVLLMLISGGLAGLAGIIQVLGTEGRLVLSVSQGYGYTAIVVALLGRLRASGVLLAALFVAFLNVGGQAMSVDEGLPFSIVVAIQGVFVLFVLVADRLSRV
jgi:general nucleoside transport system permease protein